MYCKQTAHATSMQHTGNSLCSYWGKSVKSNQATLCCRGVSTLVNDITTVTGSGVNQESAEIFVAETASNYCDELLKLSLQEMFVNMCLRSQDALPGKACHTPACRLHETSPPSGTQCSGTYCSLHALAQAISILHTCQSSAWNIAEPSGKSLCRG